MMNNWYGNGNTFGLTPFAMVGFGVFAALILLIIVVLKGYALWTAAKRDEKWWFVILLIVNTLGILELVYLAFIVGKWRKQDDSLGTTNNTTNSGN